MMKAFEDGRDIHAATAAQLFQVGLEDITPAMRRKAKIVNFGIIYGITDFGLAQQLGVSRKEAGQILKMYFSQFPAIKTYMEHTIERAREQGFVTTLLGRKGFYPNISSRNATMRGFAERAAVNMPIQGTAAELIKRAMIDIYAWQQKEGAEMVIQVHDELVFEVCDAHLSRCKKVIPLLMQEAMTLSVPIVVEVGVGANWLSAH